MRSIIIPIVLATVCAACGIKGALYLPPPPRQPAAATPAPAEASPPVSADDVSKEAASAPLAPMAPIQP
ncbi:lipoprotein [Uliginosibacterium sp. sgz301328]|uniref:LPS translocon maturation chaperone LptM n=1 Tax=Uliginosibacterium sp. sgz301328 TaxID=3243764 RepID=UPI00359D1307